MAFRWLCVILGMSTPLVVELTSSMADACGGELELLMEIFCEKRLGTMKNMDSSINKFFIG